MIYANVGDFKDPLKQDLALEFCRKGNENKVMLGDFNCTMDKLDRNGENKTQRLYRCGSNYALLKLILDNWLKDLWRKE